MTELTQVCPTCENIVTMVPYDIGSGPEMSCPQCEWCWGAEGQSLNLNDVLVLPPTVEALGDPRGKGATWTLLPVDTSGGECSQCGRLHDLDEPHDQSSLVYQYSFYAEHNRWPTWRDAVAHCDQDVAEVWFDVLRSRGVDIPDA